MNTLGANHRKRVACPNIEQLAKQIADLGANRWKTIQNRFLRRSIWQYNRVVFSRV